MRRLTNRVGALEAYAGTALSPSAKALLGWPLTEAEQREASLPVNIGNIDTRTYSRELKAWLGID